ncbi:uncharacterized protein [Onthophagus taurus]|uniref:uncharacterized protein isoform X2 n=1 Tax=Onthophagus taurus TaxID=166361 RepID=UPI0039BDCD29
MYLLLVVILIHSGYSQKNFISPVYELGSYIPPVPSSGEIEGAKPSFIPQIEVDTRIDEENEKPPVPPSFVLGSNTPISSIQPWKPSQIIPPSRPGSSSSVNKPLGAGSTSPEINNNNSIDKETINIEYKPSRPSFHPNPGNNIAQIIPSGGSKPSKVDINDRIQDENDYANYADKYPYYVVGSQKPTQKPIVLDYKPTRPFYAGSPKN